MFPEIRKRKRLLDIESTKKILSSGREGVLSTIGKNGYPYGVAVNYIYYNNCIYFHCANQGYKLENIKYNNKVSFFVSTDIEIVPDKFTTKYSSAVVFGRASVACNDEKREVLMAIGDKYSKDFMPECIRYINSDLDKCTIIKIQIDHMTGKFSND